MPHTPRWISFGLVALLIIVVPSATHAAITRSLSIGSQGPDVLDLQELLRSKGFFTYPVSTGYFGPTTAQAVAQFQIANGISPVGSVGPLTRTIINGGGGAGSSAQSPSSGITLSSSAMLPTLTRSLDPGATGADVTALQTALKSKGLLNENPTGVFDSSTVLAVIALQAQNHLETVGRVGPATRTILNQIIASLPKSGSSGTTVATAGGTASSGNTGTTIPSTPNVPTTSSGGSGGGSTASTGSSGSTGGGGGGSSGSVASTGGGGSSAPTTGTTTTITTIGSTTTPPLEAPTLTLTLSTTTLPSSGGSVTLAWSSANAPSCTASGGWTGSQTTSGTKLIQGVVKSTDFTLTCTGNSQTVVKTVSVTVAPAAPLPTVTLSTSATSVVSGGNATLTWSSTNATSCAASGSWSGGKSTSGTQALTNLTASSQYSLTCSGAGGSASQVTSIAVTAPPTIPTPPTPPVVSGSSTVVHNATELWNTLISLDGTGGTTVLLAAGNYGDVTVGAWNKGFNYPQTVTVTSQDASNRAVLHSLIVQNSSGITFSNFNVTGVGTNAYAVYSTNSSRITYGGLKVAGPDRTGVGIFSRSDSNITITNNDVGNYGVGISSFQDYGPFAITRNNVHDVESDGIDVYDGAGLVFAPNVSENYVHDFVPIEGDHPDGIQFAAFNGTVTPTVKDNLVTRGFRAGGALPPQGIFISDGPLYSNPIVTGNLAVGTLYNGITVAQSNGGTMSNNTVISFPDYGSWIRYENVTNLIISNNLASSYVTTSANTNVTLSNNTTTAGVADMTAAQPAINAWRATHPNVPTDSFQPLLALGGSPVTPITRTLAIGSTGSDVTTLQRVLKSLGLFNTEATGYLGTITKSAVTAFQKQNQLAAVGVVGPQTRALINNLLSSIKLPF